MTQRNDGGPAFPVAAGPKDGYGNPTNAPQRGMTLRQWYAGQALASIMQDKAIWDSTYDERRQIAAVLVDWADSLLAELAK